MFNVATVEETLSAQEVKNKLETNEFDKVVFQNLDLRSIDLSNETIKNAVFKNCDLSDANFSSAKLMNVAFRDCALANASFTKAKISAIFQDCVTYRSDFSYIDSFDNDSSFEFIHCLSAESNFANSRIVHPIFLRSLLDRSDFTKAKFVNINEFPSREITFEDSSFFEVSFKEAVFFGTNMENCCFYDSDFRLAVFKNCQIVHSNFDNDFEELQGITFENITLFPVFGTTYQHPNNKYLTPEIHKRMTDDWLKETLKY